MARTFDAVERAAKALFASLVEHNMVEYAFNDWEHLNDGEKDALRDVFSLALKAYNDIVIEIPSASTEAQP